MSALDSELELTIYQAFLCLPSDRLPTPPFWLNAWTRINDARWFIILRTEVIAAVAYLEGKRDRPHPRQRTGALLDQLRHLKPLLQKPAPASQEQQYAIGERVTVRGLEGAGPVYRDAGETIWICFGNTATPHDRADVAPLAPCSPIPPSIPPFIPLPPTPAPPQKLDRLPSWYQRTEFDAALPGAEVWRLTGLSYYQQLRDRMASFLANDPNASAGLTAMRRHIVAHLDGLCQQLQGGFSS